MIITRWCMLLSGHELDTPSQLQKISEKKTCLWSLKICCIDNIKELVAELHGIMHSSIPRSFSFPGSNNTLSSSYIWWIFLISQNQPFSKVKSGAPFELGSKSNFQHLQPVWGSFSQFDSNTAFLSKNYFHHDSNLSQLNLTHTGWTWLRLRLHLTWVRQSQAEPDSNEYGASSVISQSKHYWDRRICPHPYDIFLHWTTCTTFHSTLYLHHILWTFENGSLEMRIQ